MFAALRIFKRLRTLEDDYFRENRADLVLRAINSVGTSSLLTKEQKSALIEELFKELGI